MRPRFQAGSVEGLHHRLPGPWEKSIPKTLGLTFFGLLKIPSVLTKAVMCEVQFLHSCA